MSYCRWSSDNWKCDLYCYEDCMGGWTTHVAAKRIVGDAPVVPNILETQPEEWLAAERRQMLFLEHCDRAPIGLPFDGQTFNDPDLAAFRERIISLLEIGYHGTPYLLRIIDEEINDERPLTPAQQESPHGTLRDGAPPSRSGDEDRAKRYEP